MIKSPVSPSQSHMAVAAAQLRGSATVAQRHVAFRVPSSCRWQRHPLAGSLKLSVSTSGVGGKPFGFSAKIATKCANENTRTEELNSRSDQAGEHVEAVEDVTPPKRSAKIHDFCFGIPFGGLLFCMGLLGYFFSRSTVSLVLGVAPGLATLLLGTLSLNFWRSGRSSFLFILGQAAISAVLAWKYSHAYLLTNRILPWGFYASLSTAMACFYAYVLLAGGNPPPKKLALAPSS
ncbi:hypothetical protein CFC21_024115 [Triticum aestivum]|uniref:Protein FATTY ACID EXPORT 1, chloroplastic n=3 Tax=Triticum TaxID=4564 RepID=A0A9R1RPB9_TRITD|nr:protein FATTY ACID EXPORT 1, chloroplastic-like [Triticum dicoccoides]XP_044324832.1 protein FATTY ACID EXPORT 1, chloroplastic-like [Triticum aestivum]KAF7009600.1 hypothetical protein CFC21_024115 [Triticum aestivum]VAH48678.1 unnamed protein product [Triticum turgidum subsp. durum]